MSSALYRHYLWMVGCRYCRWMDGVQTLLMDGRGADIAVGWRGADMAVGWRGADIVDG